LRGTMGHQQIAIAEQEVETAMAGYLRAPGRDVGKQAVGVRGLRAKVIEQRAEQMAESLFTVGFAAGEVTAPVSRREALQVAVVGEYPIPLPQPAAEGVAVANIHPADRRPADMGDDIGGTERPVQQSLGVAAAVGGGVARLEMGLTAMIIGQAPAISVVVGAAAATKKSPQ